MASDNDRGVRQSSDYEQQRLESVERMMNKWRSEEKPASGAPVYIEQKATAKAKKNPPNTGEAERDKRNSTNENQTIDEDDSTKEAKHGKKSDRIVSIEMSPGLKKALVAMVCLCMLACAAYGLQRLFNSLNAAPNSSLTASSDAVSVEETEAPSDELEAEADTDGDTTVDDNIVATTAQAVVRTGTTDGTKAHIIDFSTDDGNIYISELNKSYVVSGGVAHIVISDAYWFDDEPANDAVADVTLHPVLTRTNGSIAVLDDIHFTAEVPASPLELIQPANGYEEVLISLYSVQMKVLPGSKVTVNGNDMSDFIDRRGNLSVNQTVEAIGDNIVNVAVLTPGHKETRTRVVLYRPVFEIPLELDINTIDSTTRADITISGTFEGSATLDVTPAPSASTIDHANGTFRFDITLTRIGDNTITITASEDGKESSVITHNIYYLPTEAEYSSKAWKMDYQALLNYYSIWQGRIFLCQGVVTEILPDEPSDSSADETAPNQQLILNVGSGTQQLVYIDNYSTAIVEAGRRYKMFADVAGLKNGYPYLIARYIYVDE